MPIYTLSHLGEFLHWVPHSGEFLHWVPTSSCWLCWVRLCTFPLGPLVLWTAPKYSHIGAHNPAGGGNQALCMCTFPGLLCTLGYSWEFPHWCPLLPLVARTRHCVCMFQCALGNSHLDSCWFAGGWALAPCVYFSPLPNSLCVLWGWVSPMTHCQAWHMHSPPALGSRLCGTCLQTFVPSLWAG